MQLTSFLIPRLTIFILPDTEIESKAKFGTPLLSKLRLILTLTGIYNCLETSPALQIIACDQRGAGFTDCRPVFAYVILCKAG